MFYILVLYVISHLGINPPPSGISKIIFIFFGGDKSKSQWHLQDRFYLFGPTIQGNLVLPTLCIGREMSEAIVCSYLWLYLLLKGTGPPFSLSHLLLCHICCLHWVQFYRFKTQPPGLPKLLFTHSFIKSQLLKTKRKFTTMKFPMMRTSKSKAHHKNKTRNPNQQNTWPPYSLHCVSKGL